MNMNELAVEVSKGEGLKKQVNIAQIKEILKVLGLIIVRKPQALVALMKYGKRKDAES